MLARPQRQTFFLTIDGDETKGALWNDVELLIAGVLTAGAVDSSNDQVIEFLDNQISKEHFNEADERDFNIDLQSLFWKPRQRRQLLTDSAQYPIAPTSTA